MLAVCVRCGSNPAGGPRAPWRRSGHSSAAELVRSHQAPGTVSRCRLTVLDRVHGVGIVSTGTGLCFQPVCVRGVAPRWFSRDCGFRRRFPGRKGVPGGFGAASRRASGHGRAGRDPRPRAGWLNWRGVVVEWAKASAPGRRVAPGRSARQVGKSNARRTCSGLGARWQPAGG